MNKLKNILFVFLLVGLLFVGFVDETPAQGTTGLFSQTITATNDTVLGSWIDIGYANHVVLGISTSDSAGIKVTVNYKIGGNSSDTYASYTDSLFTNVATGTYLPLVLRGFLGNSESVAAQDTVAGTIDRIPGANYVKVNVYRNPDNGTEINAVTCTWRGYLIYRP